MIKIKNDYILKQLPNNDIPNEENSYTNTFSTELFKPSVSSGETKYVLSSTGLYIPTYQPNPTDVWQWWDVDSSPWIYFASSTTTQNQSCRARYDAYGKPTTNIDMGYTQRYKDSNNYERRYRVAFPSSLPNYSEITPVTLEMINPDTNQYEQITLYFSREYQRTKTGSTLKRTYPYRINVYWCDQNLNKTYIFESIHFNILDDEDYPPTGYALTAVPYFYMYADLAYDILNHEFVGILNLFLHLSQNNYNYVYFSADDTIGNHFTYRMLEDTAGPFESISTKSYSDIGGPASGLYQLYRRAFKLDTAYRATLETEDKTLSMNKIGCYGPNTLISP